MARDSDRTLFEMFGIICLVIVITPQIPLGWLSPASGLRSAVMLRLPPMDCFQLLLTSLIFASRPTDSASFPRLKWGCTL